MVSPGRALKYVPSEELSRLARVLSEMVERGGAEFRAAAVRSRHVEAALEYRNMHPAAERWGAFAELVGLVPLRATVRRDLAVLRFYPRCTHGRCTGCTYLLAGLDGPGCVVTCPECGTRSLGRMAGGRVTDHLVARSAQRSILFTGSPRRSDSGSM